MHQFAATSRPAVHIAAGTQTATSGTAIFSNSNGLTFGMAGSQTVTATADYVRSISAGTTNATGNQIVFSNSNGISFSAYSDSRITATADYVRSISAGTTNATGNQIVFSNSAQVVFGVAGATVTAQISTATTASQVTTVNVIGTNSNRFALEDHQHAGVAAIGISTQTGTWNTSGDTATRFGTWLIAGGPNITVSGVTGAGGLNTLLVSANPGVNVSFFQPEAGFQNSMAMGNASLSFRQFNMPFNMNAVTFRLLADVTGADANTGAYTISCALYTMSGSTASLASSGSGSRSWASTAIAGTATSLFGGNSGTRWRTVSVSYSMTPGDYLVGFLLSTAGSLGGMTLFGNSSESIVGAEQNHTQGFFHGFSTSSTTAFPASFNVTATSYVRTGASALRQPGFQLQASN